MARGLDRPPRWALAVITVGVLAIAAEMFYGATHRPRDPLSAAEQQRMATAVASMHAQQKAKARTVAFLGDSYTAGVGATSPDTSYASLTAQELGIHLLAFGQGGTGYTNPGTGAEAVYGDRVAQVVAAHPTIVVVQGSTNDYQASQAQIQDAAAKVFAALRQGLPGARVFALGPLDTPASNPLLIRAARTAVSQAAQANGVTYIDPNGWLNAADGSEFVDGFHPTQASHQVIADKLAAALTAAGVQPATQ